MTRREKICTAEEQEGLAADNRNAGGQDGPRIVMIAEPILITEPMSKTGRPNRLAARYNMEVLNQKMKRLIQDYYCRETGGIGV